MQKRTVLSLANLGGIVVGGAGGNPVNAVNAGSAAENAVGNNYLSFEEQLEQLNLTKALLGPKCKNGGCPELQERLDFLYRLDKDRDRHAEKICKNPRSKECGAEVEQLSDFKQKYNDKGFKGRILTNNTAVLPDGSIKKADAQKMKKDEEYFTAPFMMQQIKISDFEEKFKVSQRNPDIHNFIVSGKDFVKDSVRDPLLFNALVVSAAFNEASRQTLKEMSQSFDEFMNRPIDESVSKMHAEKMQVVRNLKMQGREDEADRAINTNAMEYTSMVFMAQSAVKAAPKAARSASNSANSAINNVTATVNKTEFGRIITADPSGLTVVTVSKSGNISASQINKFGLPISLSKEEKIWQQKLTNPTISNQFSGEIREHIVNSYFSKNDFIRLEGKCNSQCFDGVFVKNNEFYLAEVKPLKPEGSIGLSAKAKSGTQMDDAWVRNRIQELKKSKDPNARETGRMLEKALNEGRPIHKTVIGVNSTEANMVYLGKVAK